jgi:hypothetical protein
LKLSPVRSARIQEIRLPEKTVSISKKRKLEKEKITATNDFRASVASMRIEKSGHDVIERHQVLAPRLALVGFKFRKLDLNIRQIFLCACGVRTTTSSSRLLTDAEACNHHENTCKNIT